MRRAVLGAAGVVVAGGAAAGGWAVASSESSATSAEAKAPAVRVGRATIERRTLTDRQTVGGTLGYGTERTVLARGSGTVSWLPAEGSTVRCGRAIAKIDGEPVVLFSGTVPAYRALQSGVSDGEDVRQLERGLVDLGYDPGTVDAAWSAETTAAVQAWQDDLGLERTGVVELGRVVFLPGDRRIARRKVEIGAVLGGGGDGGGGGAAAAAGSGSGAATAVLTTTSTRPLVTLDLDAADQELAKAGASVQVELPDGDRIPGRVDEVGKVATAEAADDAQGSDTPSASATIAVTVRLTGKDTGGGLDEAPVTVDLAREVRREVLTAPVTALVAQRGGGYALDVIEGGRRRLVRVQAGLFADGLVEVTGDGLRHGTLIVVPAE